MHVRRGDLVQVISGADRGKQGRVLKVDHKHDRIKVEGIRIATRHVKPAAGKPGSIDKREAYIPSCKVMPIDPGTGKPTRVYMREVDGKRVRVGKSGQVIESQPAAQS